MTPDEHYVEAERILVELARGTYPADSTAATAALAHATLAIVDPRRAARQVLRDRVDRQRAELIADRPDAPPPRVVVGND